LIVLLAVGSKVRFSGVIMVIKKKGAYDTHPDGLGGGNCNFEEACLMPKAL